MAMIEVSVDERLLEEIAVREVQERLSKIETDKVFWSWNDLVEVTSMSKGHILNNFFDDERFKRIRRRVGRKWLFPVEETREFLVEWLEEQPNE